MIPPVVSLMGVSKRYGTQTALEDITLTIAEGERLALLGQNGAGKTTLIKLVLGLSRPSEGTVRVLGFDPADGGAQRGGCTIGFLPESIAFHEAMTGRELLAFYARMKGQEPRKNGELLERVGLEAAADKRIKTYSKGMRQRLGLAQVLLGRPRLLLLDEPTSGLDPAFRAIFYDIIDSLVGSGSTVIFASHVLSELAARTDRVAILNGGHIIALGSLAELGRTASLHARIRVTVPSGRGAALALALNGSGELAHVNGRSVELTCPVQQKVALLQRIHGLEIPIEDIEVASPSLEEVFSHFMAEGVQP